MLKLTLVVLLLPAGPVCVDGAPAPHSALAQRGPLVQPVPEPPPPLRRRPLALEATPRRLAGRPGALVIPDPGATYRMPQLGGPNVTAIPESVPPGAYGPAPIIPAQPLERPAASVVVYSKAGSSAVTH
jgi:hypothetical protein